VHILYLTKHGFSEAPFQQVSFARTYSDTVVKWLDVEHYEECWKWRLQHRSEYLPMYPIILSWTYIFCSEATHYTNLLKQKFHAQHLANESEAYITFLINISSVLDPPYTSSVSHLLGKIWAHMPHIYHDYHLSSGSQPTSVCCPFAPVTATKLMNSFSLQPPPPHLSWIAIRLWMMDVPLCRKILWPGSL